MFQSINVKIASGSTNDGAHHRAVAIASELHKAGAWDGSTEIWIEQPEQLHSRMFGLEGLKIKHLVPGIHYTVAPLTARALTLDEKIASKLPSIDTRYWHRKASACRNPRKAQMLGNRARFYSLRTRKVA